MRVRRWLLVVFVAAALVAGGSVVHEWYLSLLPRLGPLDVAPAAPQVSIRVGERLRFTAAAEGATGFTWLLWGRPVSFDPSWSYAPAPEEAGWQQVTVEVTGRTGLRLTRTWDVGVVAPVVPEIESLEPPAGELVATAGEKLTFRARAHLPAARDVDQLAFEWLMDDRPVLREERPADAALSELVLPAIEPGSHRLRLRVTEDGRTASLADWALDVGTSPVVAATPAPEGGIVASTGPLPEPPRGAPAAAEVVEPVPPSTVAPTVVAAPPPPPHLVPMAGPRRLEVRVGKPIVLEASVEPTSVRVSYRWTVDGKRVASRGGRLEYTPRKPGRQEIAVRVDAGRQQLGHDAWIVTARTETPPTATLAATPRILRVPASAELQADVGKAVVFEARVEGSGGDLSYQWTVDGRAVRRALSERLEYEAREPGRHTVAVSVASDRKEIGQASWVVAVRAQERPARVAASPPVSELPESKRAAAELAEADVRRWLDDYAHAWSRKDLGALRRMGQVQTPAEAAQLERYFQSIDSLEVDVRILTLTVDGERASVEFERTDTVTDPSGRRQQLRLPPMRKEIERTPDGLRFAARRAAG